jgi:transglutaminase-like putative cysteine protease
MMRLVLLALLAFPAWQNSLEVVVPPGYQGVIRSYANSNFSQQLVNSADGMLVKLDCSRINPEKLSFPILADDDAIAELDPALQQEVHALFQQAYTLEYYLRNIRLYLQRFSYSEDDAPQDALTVLRSRHGHCVGLTNLTQLLLRYAGVRSQVIRGFYLKQDGQTARPISHRWLEIQIAKNLRFFFDPQYADFSVNYIVANDNVSFDQIPTFNGLVIKRKRVLSDE